MQRMILLTAAILSGMGLATSYVAHAETFVYPDKGQNEEQQNRDKWECHQWAVQQTGVDPTKIAQEASSAEAAEAYGGPRRFGLLRGGAGGAALGAAGGAIGGNAGEGAAIGAAVGGLLSVLRARQETEYRHQAYANMAASQQQQLRNYDSAWATCLRGRGYTVSR